MEQEWEEGPGTENGGTLWGEVAGPGSGQRGLLCNALMSDKEIVFK